MQQQNIFHDAGIRETPIRKAILSIFESSKTPLSAQDIESHKNLATLHPDTVTIYRTLETFCDAGIIRRIELQEGKFRYELEREHHHHIVCVSCGKIQDIHDCIDEPTQRRIEKETGFTIQRHSLEFFGVCADCKTA